MAPVLEGIAEGSEDEDEFQEAMEQEEFYDAPELQLEVDIDDAPVVEGFDFVAPNAVSAMDVDGS